MLRRYRGDGLHPPRCDIDGDERRRQRLPFGKARRDCERRGEVAFGETAVAPYGPYSPPVDHPDPETWIINLQTMQDSVLRTLEMIDRKDILGFTERGALINESCETCHAQYWYKPLPMPR